MCGSWTMYVERRGAYRALVEKLEEKTTLKTLK
jgi:hypothetical protein